MKEFNFDGYKKIVQSTEKDLVEYLGRQIPKLYGAENCVVTDDYIFAKGKCPIILCAHMDTVFKVTPSTILYDEKQELIWSPDGIGGDDRNGIYAIIYLLSKMKDNLPYVMFTTGEETGCVGAGKAVKAVRSRVEDVLFAIQIDRQGSDDAVFYQCKNKEFVDYICKFGYKETPGSRTDICVFCPDWKIAGVNFSCGYRNNHTEKEIVNIKDLFNTINMVKKILDDAPNAKKYPFEEIHLKEEKTKTSGNMKKEDKSEQLSINSPSVGVFGKTPQNDDAILLAVFGVTA